MSTPNTTTEYLFLFRGSDWDRSLSPAELQTTMASFVAWFERLSADGTIKAGQPLIDDGAHRLGKKRTPGRGRPVRRIEGSGRRLSFGEGRQSWMTRSRSRSSSRSSSTESSWRFAPSPRNARRCSGRERSLRRNLRPRRFEIRKSNRANLNGRIPCQTDISLPNPLRVCQRGKSITRVSNQH